jgi:L-phenylalanine/L-methionine N-acetyltransferase
LDLVVRHVADGDVEAVHEILTSPHVVSGSMRVPLAPPRQTRERLTPARGVYQLVAVVATHPAWVRKGGRLRDR